MTRQPYGKDPIADDMQAYTVVYTRKGLHTLRRCNFSEIFFLTPLRFHSFTPTVGRRAVPECVAQNILSVVFSVHSETQHSALSVL